MGGRLRSEVGDRAASIWRVPGLNILKTQSWTPLTVQEVASGGGEGVWRSNKHRVSLLLDDASDFAVQFNSGHTQEFSGPGPRLFFCPAGATMRVRSGPMRWVQAVQDPAEWLALSTEHWDGRRGLEPLADLHDPVIIHLMRALAALEDDPSSRLLADNLNAALSLRLVRFRLDPQGVDATGLSRRQLCDVLEYIETNLADELSLVRLAGVAGLSPWHFSRSFKRSMGIGLHGFVMERRIKRARVLLSDRSASIAAVAADVGFGSQASFTTCFRRQTGVTPGQYRRRL
jgi:AraC family transcriptional regulator